MRARGRPRKGAPKVVNEKRVLQGLKRELGLREDRVREFGFFEDVQEDEEGRRGEDEPGEEFSAAAAAARTRLQLQDRPEPLQVWPPLQAAPAYDRGPGAGGGRTRGPPRPYLPAPRGPRPRGAGGGGGPPPAGPQELHSSRQVGGGLVATLASRYVCKVCGKLYLGDRKMARHLKVRAGELEAVLTD